MANQDTTIVEQERLQQEKENEKKLHDAQEDAKKKEALHALRKSMLPCAGMVKRFVFRSPGHSKIQLYGEKQKKRIMRLRESRRC